MTSMGEAHWTPAERVYMVRPAWAPAAIEAWTDALWGHGRRFIGFGGCLFWLVFGLFVLIWICAKATVWLWGIVAILLAQGVVVIYDIATYYHRRAIAS